MKKIIKFLKVHIFIIFFILISCKREKDPIEIKLLLLNPENYLNQNISIHGNIKEVGPLGLWFILEDDSAYIQVTTQHISEKISCLKRGQAVSAFGQLEQYSVHKYFSL